MRPAFILLQHVLPHHLISRVVMGATRVRLAPVKNLLIRWFMRGYQPDLSDSELTDPEAYPSFNAFFTRALAPGARPLAPGAQTLLCPVDGALSQCGDIDGRRIFQAKGHDYTLDALLAGAAPEWAARFEGGRFATIYLAPVNYHRIHMPADGRLVTAWYVPGRLFTVNNVAAANVPGLFARNERVVLLFEGTPGPFAVILVGALNVGSMATVWHGDVAPRRPRRDTELPLPAGVAAELARGLELGRFNMGSTVILLFGPDRVSLDERLRPGLPLRMGEALGQIRS